MYGTIYDRLTPAAEQRPRAERSGGRAADKGIRCADGEPGRVRAPRVREPVGLPVTGRLDHGFDERSTQSTSRPVSASPQPVVVISLAGVAARAERRGGDVPGARPRLSAPDAQLATDQAVLRRVPQRPREDRRRQLRGITPESIGQHADVFEKAVRKLRGRVMPPPGAAARRRGRRLAGRLARRRRSIARPARRTCRTRSCCTGSIARNTRTRFAISWPSTSTRRELLPADDVGRGLRQHRDGAAGVAVLHRAIRHRRARRRREGGRPAGCAARRVDVPRRTRHAAHARRPAFRSARAAAFSPRSISRPTANTRSTSPTWPPTSGATAWSSRTRWW